MTKGGNGFETLWDDGVVTFILNRPEKLNTLTKDILDGFEACIDAMERDGPGLLVITGQGAKAFCAGTDLAELQNMPLEMRLAKNDRARALLVRLSRSQLISVAAINGMALGGGLELAMACTFRIAHPGATFGLPEVLLGLLPAYAGTQFLPRLVGPSRAEELTLTGRTIDISEALQIGLIHRATASSENLIEAATAFGKSVTAHSPAAIAAIRECIRASAGPEDAGLSIEGRSVRSVFSGPDAEQGVTRFLNRNRG